MYACMQAVDILALKKSSNNEVYEHIKKSFDEELAKKEFIEINEENNFKDKGNVKTINSSIRPLQDFATNSNR